jgi:hypothetical protein
MQQSVVVTFLPQDESKTGVGFRASLFVSPRLTPDAPDSRALDFPAFGDWPAVIAEARIAVERRNGETIEVRADQARLSSHLWATYLAPLPVRGWTYHDLSATELRSFPAQSILALTQGLYQAVASQGGGGHPDPFAGGLRDLAASYAHLGETRDARDGIIDGALADRARTRLEVERGQRPREPGGLAPRVTPLTPDLALADRANAALDLAEARRFYDRPEARDPDEAAYPRPDPENYAPPKIDQPHPDFHDMLGALADHPELLEALGIVVTFELDPAFVISGDYRATLDHPALAGNAITQQPWTRAVVEGRFFQPVSETGDVVDGLLSLDDPNRYDVAQVDVDSTALLVEQRIANVYPIADAASEDQPIATDLPALRSSGFTVTRLRRQMILSDRIARSKDNATRLEAGDDVVLFAEDLLRGFRVDVDDGSVWRSLMHRGVRYLNRTTRAEELNVADQEAYLKASSLTSVPNATVDRHYLHESVFGWDGWSLAVQRPGKHLPREPEQHDVTRDQEKFPGDLDLEIEIQLLAGTLPRLRYGDTYRFRARTVDLAGHSTPFAMDDPSTARQVFRRFQPVSHPTVVPRHAYTEGESALRLVVRSGVNADNTNVASPVDVIDPTTYAASLAAATPRTYATFRADSQRHLSAPKVGQLEAELHGTFDDAIGTQGGPAALYRAAFARAQREQGTFADRELLDASDPDVRTPTVGIRLVPPLAREEEFQPLELQATLDALGRGDAPDAGFVIIHDTNDLKVPYLPDPLAFGIALRFIGGGTASGWEHTELLAYEGAWPDLEPYRLLLQGGGSPSVVATGRVVTVTLPPGGTAVVRSSSRLRDVASLERLGLWGWIDSTVPAARVSHVVDGGHQMITPGEVLILVHATQRPLVRPSFRAGFAAVREYGQTFCQFTGVLNAQVATSGRIDVGGRWAEWVDDPAIGKPERVEGRSAHAFDLVLPEGHGDDLDLGSGDAGQLRHDFGDHKHRRISYSPIATTRFREYLPAAQTTDAGNLRVVGPATTIHVPNSRRPSIPVIDSVIPTFDWREEPDDPLDSLARSRSRVGGLRVWLERPWYPSGEGEMLGVVLSGADGILRDADVRRQYVSLWGKDPIRSNGELAAAVPRPRDFSGEGMLHMDRLTIEETANAHPGVSVVGHPVRYSEARDKWYADLTIDPGEAYWPFLRLAVARFQPWSVTNAHLSRIVIVDFVQLTNRRTATISRPDRDTVRVTVTGIEERRPTVGLLPGASGTFDRRAAIDAVGWLSRPRGVRAWIERRGATASDLDWQRVGDTIDIERIDEDEVMRVWSGDVPLAIPLAIQRPGVEREGASSDWRVVLTEWESLPQDEPSGLGHHVERIVYLDRFRL